MENRTIFCFRDALGRMGDGIQIGILGAVIDGVQFGARQFERHAQFDQRLALP